MFKNLKFYITFIELGDLDHILSDDGSSCTSGSCGHLSTEQDCNRATSSKHVNLALKKNSPFSGNYLARCEKIFRTTTLQT